MKILSFALGITLFAPLLAPVSQPGPATAHAAVRVTLSPPQATLRDPDDTVNLTVEIHNDGAEDVYVSHLLVGFENAPAKLVLEVSDAAGYTFKCESLNMILSEHIVREWWTKVAPNHFYGSEVKLNAATCECLRTAGDYTLLAKYASHGGTIPANSEWNMPAHPVWKGEVTSNVIKVHVLGTINPPPKKRG